MGSQMEQENETSDVELIQKAEELYGKERLLKANHAPIIHKLYSVLPVSY